MPRPVEFSRPGVVAAAMETFWRLGYEATSVEDLTKATGLSRSSLYLAFGNKEGLFQAALDAYEEQAIGSMLADLETGTGGLAAVRGFFARVADDAGRDPAGLGRGCLMTNSLTELGAGRPGMQERAERYATRLRAAFRRSLEQAARAKQITGADLDGRADLLATLVLGTWVRAKGEADPAVHARLAGSVEQLLRAWRPTRT